MEAKVELVERERAEKLREIRIPRELNEIIVTEQTRGD